MAGIEQRQDNMSSLHPPSQLKLRCNSATEFTFCSIPKQNGNENPPLVYSPSFGPKKVYSGYTSSSPTTNTQNKITDMMTNLPESSLELSLKDIVVDDTEKVPSLVELTSDLKTSFKGKKRSRGKSPISRSVSLDTGVFMLKMFAPISFGTKKSRSSSNMCSNSNSFGNKSSKRSSGKSDDKSMHASTKSRSAESAPVGCWFINKPWKPTSKRGCVF